MMAGVIEVERVSQGTLVERMRAAGVGLGSVLTATGIGTPVEDGKQVVEVGGRRYLLEKPIRAEEAFCSLSGPRAANERLKHDLVALTCSGWILLKDGRHGSVAASATTPRNVSVDGRTPCRTAPQFGRYDATSPVIIETISFLSVAAVCRTPICRPRRSTQMRSERRNTWSRLWEMIRIARSRAFSAWTVAPTRAISATPSAAVGSSSSTSLRAQWVARAMAMPWRCPPP